MDRRMEYVENELSYCIGLSLGESPILHNTTGKLSFTTTNNNTTNLINLLDL